ncbi:MAG: HD domain-containing protein [Treponema sp.]|nr:HD domain-containing protein [Treponema sp.]
MDTIKLEELREDLTFTGDLLIDSTFLLLPRTANVSADMIKRLKEWGFESILCDGSLSLGGDIGISEGDEEFDGEPKEKIGQNIKKVLQNSKNSQIGNSDQARLEMVQQVYDEYMNYIEQVFTHYATHKEIDQTEIQETVQELCVFIKEHRRYILRVNASVDANKKNFLVTHSMRTTVLAIAIALQLHIPLSKMIDLGVTCILHEIGMLRIPPQLYMTSRKLTSNERAQITKHTLFGYTIVKDLGFSLPIQLGVLEHHEKENGTGYPRHMSGEKISSNAKIIAVACTYEAISSPRSYKDERSTFDALIELIQNKNHQYDDSILKGLLYTVSLYPIGTYVYLSNRKVAEVIDSNPDNPKCPVVQILTEKEADGSLKVVQTGKDNISILRILSKQEKEDILKVIDEKEHGKPFELEPISDDYIEEIPVVATPKVAAAPVEKPVEAAKTAEAPVNKAAEAPKEVTKEAAKPAQTPTPSPKETAPAPEAKANDSKAPENETKENKGDNGDGMESVDIADFM